MQRAGFCVPLALLAACVTSPAPPSADRCPNLSQPGRPRWERVDPYEATVIVNRVEAGPGEEVRWNGVAITEATLMLYVARAARMEPLPITLLIVRPESDCARLRRLAAGMETASGCTWDRCNFGFHEVDRPHP
jgi:hypothetical protein